MCGVFFCFIFVLHYYDCNYTKKPLETLFSIANSSVLLLVKYLLIPMAQVFSDVILLTVRQGSGMKFLQLEQTYWHFLLKCWIEYYVWCLQRININLFLCWASNKELSISSHIIHTVHFTFVKYTNDFTYFLKHHILQYILKLNLDMFETYNTQFDWKYFLTAPFWDFRSLSCTDIFSAIPE